MLTPLQFRVKNNSKNIYWLIWIQNYAVEYLIIVYHKRHYVFLLISTVVTLLVTESFLLKLFMSTLCLTHADIKQHSFCIIVNLVLLQFIVYESYCRSIYSMYDKE